MLIVTLTLKSISCNLFSGRIFNNTISFIYVLRIKKIDVFIFSLNNFWFLVVLCLSKYRVTIKTVIKLYLLCWICLGNRFGSIRFIVLFSCVDFNNDFVVNNGLNFLSLLMVLVLILVSSCVMNNSIDYLSIMEGRIFLVYILLFQFSMITFVLSNDPIIVSLNWDWLSENPLYTVFSDLRLVFIC